jgi:hypothetical protein
MKMEGGTAELYDAIDGRLGIDGDPPEGLIFHSAGPIDGGWGIIDFWESRADFDAFSSRIVAGMASAGVEPSGPPDIKEFPVHETIHA